MRTLLFFLVVLSAFAARRADACAGACNDVSLEAALVPSTVPALPLHRAFDSSYTATLFGPDGGPLLSSINGNTLVPGAPLEPNASYAVKFSGLRCNVDGGSYETFATTDASPLPTAALGTVAVSAQTIGPFQTLTGCGNCSVNLYAARRVFSLNVDDATIPFAQVVESTLRVDGVERAHNRGLDGGAVEHSVFSRCRREPLSTVYTGLEPGTHTGEISVTITGGSTRTSAPFTFSLSCDGLCVNVNTSCFDSDTLCDAGVVTLPPDGGPDLPDASVLPQATDAGIDGGVTVPSAPSGCSTTPMSMLVGLAFVLIIRRKTKQ